MSPHLAIFGITNGTLNTVVQFLLLGLVVVWIALIVYTYADARRRISDPILVGCATAASLFPYIGTVIYMIVRPPEYLEDVRERDLEIQATELRMNDATFLPCPHCDYPVGRDYLRCPSCLRKLRDSCASCTKPLDPDWRICPYCEAEIAGVTPPPRSRRRTGTTAEDPAVTPAPAAAAGVAAASGSRSRRGSSTTKSETPGPEGAPASSAGRTASSRRRSSKSADTASVGAEPLKPDEAMAPRRTRTGTTGSNPSVPASDATPPAGGAPTD